MKTYPHIIPSLLAANFANLGEELNLMKANGITMIHFDVMDGHFVPNISFGVPVLKSLTRASTLLFDVHLMIAHPHQFVQPFLEAGASIITFHVETIDGDQGLDLIKTIHSHGAKAGISLKPNTDIRELSSYLHVVDVVLVMGVEPGFGGQAFLPSALEKIKHLDALRRQHGYSFLIEVDGGIDQHTGPLCLKAGCDRLVAGSYVFGHDDLSTRLNALTPER
jgi:ribulose-phosphate 3-epimerase